MCHGQGASILNLRAHLNSTCAASKASVCHRHGVQRCAEKLVVAMSVLALSAADLRVHCCESRGVRLPSRLSFCWHSVVYSSDGRVVCCPLGSAGCQSSVSPSSLSLETAVYHMNCKQCNCRCGSFGRGLRLGCRCQLWSWSSPGLSFPALVVVVAWAVVALVVVSFALVVKSLLWLSLLRFL